MLSTKSANNVNLRPIELKCCEFWGIKPPQLPLILTFSLCLAPVVGNGPGVRISFMTSDINNLISCSNENLL